MSAMSLLWLIVLLLPFFSYIYYRWGYAPYQVFKQRNIPGPPPLPFLGNVLPMVCGKEGMENIAGWSQVYGPVCGFFSGAWPALAITDHAMIQQIFITNFRCFQNRCKMTLLNTQATGLPPGIFECDPDRWKLYRHITLPAFTNLKLRKMSLHLERSCSLLLDRMLEESASKQSISVIELYKEYVLEVTVLAVLGQEVWLQRGESRDFRQWIELGSNMSHGSILPSLINLPVDTFIGSQFPWFKKLYFWLAPGQYLPMFRKFKAILNACVTEKRQRAEAKQLQENCVLDLMVAASGPEDGKQLLSDDEVISTCINFLFAAYDTTSLTLTCCSHQLAIHTHVQDKLCGLLDDYWSQHPDASVTTVAQEVPYLDMVIDETLRLYPPSPKISRECTEDTEVRGIQIPKGMNIVVPIRYLHQMKSVWGDPEVFRPERFEKEESASRPPCSFMPMGIGPRNCVGIKFAKLITKMCLASLLRRHRFTKTPQTEPELVTECSVVTLSLKSSVILNLQAR